MLLAAPVEAAPYAAVVMDSRTGEVLHSRNADSRLHPASLTKMMTLYVAFEAVERGEINLDTKVTISRKAATEEPSRLGLRSGQKIALRYLIRAAAVKSANDASTAIAEAISGSEAAFVRRMNRTAKSIGMKKTSFRNAHGLTESGHLSTARDMTILGRQLLFDFPDYYNLFSRGSTHAGVRTVRNTNRNFLKDYSGADGIKTGYTRAAGYNLVASAKRRQERIIVTVFGGRSAATRNSRVAELMDMGFKRAPSQARVARPSRPLYQPNSPRLALNTSRPPIPRPEPAAPPRPTTLAAVERVSPGARSSTLSDSASDELLLALGRSVEAAVREAFATPEPEGPQVVLATSGIAEGIPPPKPRPGRLTPPTPAKKGEPTVLASAREGDYGVRLGLFPSRDSAERMLLQTALVEIGTLHSADRRVNHRSAGYEASFVGMSKAGAASACERLSSRNLPCEVVSP